MLSVSIQQTAYPQLKLPHQQTADWIHLQSKQ